MSYGRSVFVMCDYDPDGVGCDEEFALLGGATFPQLMRAAKKEGWREAARPRRHYCPQHKGSAP